MYDFYYIGKFSLIGIRKLTLVIPIQSIIIIYFLQCLAIDNQSNKVMKIRSCHSWNISQWYVLKQSFMVYIDYKYPEINKKNLP